MATEERTPPLDCVAGKPVDMDKVLKHWWHGHEHDPAAMRDYAARGIVSAADLFEEVRISRRARACGRLGRPLTVSPRIRRWRTLTRTEPSSSPASTRESS